MIIVKGVEMASESCNLDECREKAEKMRIPESIKSYLYESFGEPRLMSFARRASSPPGFTTLRLNVLKCPTAEEQQLRFAELEAVVKTEYEEKGMKDLSSALLLQHPDIENVAVIQNKRSNFDESTKHNNDVFVDELCGCAVLRGADVFVNGILGAPDALQVSDFVRVFAVCDRHYKKGSKLPYTGDLPMVYVGSGISRVDREMLFKKNKLESGLAVRMTHPRLIAPSLSALDSRIWIAQNLPSLVCALNVEAQPGDRILDMCAAPGGKCLHLAAVIKNQGQIIALDRSKAKIDALKEKLQPLGVTCIRAFACDSTTILCQRDSTNEISPSAQTVVQAIGDIDLDAPPYLANTFDRILLDAPCSNLGQRPRFTLSESVDALRSYSTIQFRLFDTAVRLLKSRGTLVYSTCTLNVDENERLVAWALDRYRGVLTLTKQRVHLGGFGSVSAGFPEKPTGLTEQQAKLVQKFDFTEEVSPDLELDIMSTPESSQLSHVLREAARDTIGFFIAKFEKI